MKKMKSLLHSKHGETLVESLLSVLIFTLSSILLLSMIAKSSSINYAAKVADQARQAELSAAESGEGQIVGGTVTIEIGGSPAESFGNISVCRKEAGALYSYFLSAPTLDVEP